LLSCELRALLRLWLGANRAPALLGLLALTAFQMALLAPELRLAPFPLNDDVMHLAAALEARDRLGGPLASTLDPWLPFWSLGYPLWHAYQPLAHWISGVVLAALPRLDPLSAFTGLKVLLLLAFPWSVYAGGRGVGLTRCGALFAASMGVLTASDGLYGFEYGSYVWRGSGLQTQLLASVLVPLALARGVVWLREGRGFALAGGLLALTLLAHLLFGYLTGVALLVAGVALTRSVGWRPIALRVAALALPVGLLSAFFLVPLLLDSSAILHSRWEPAWKWDSFGHERVLSWMIDGALWDHGRWPLLTLWALAGLALAAWRRSPLERMLAAGMLVMLALFFGRPTWGLLLDLLVVPHELHLHRVAGMVQLFGCLLGGHAAATLWSAVRGRGWRTWAVGLLLPASLVPAALERTRWSAEGDAWARASEQARHAAEPELVTLRARLDSRQGTDPGRIFAGLATQWGAGFKVGAVPLYAFLSVWRVDTLGFLFHSMSPPADAMVLFDENRPDHYAVFDVRTVVMPAERTPPAFLTALQTLGAYAVLAAPGEGRVGLGRAAYECPATGEAGFECASAWLAGPWPAHGLYAVQAEPGAAHIPGLPRVERWQPAPFAPGGPPAGRVLAERRERDSWRAEVEATDEALVVLRESFHPGWHVHVDGVPVPALRVAPGFVAARVPRGLHAIEFRWAPGAAKAWLLGLGLLGFAGLLVACRRWPARIQVPPAERSVRSGTGLLAGSSVALVLLVSALPLLSGRLGAGHDASEYPPRLVEFHENVRQGQFPAWAPDLGNGYGQPLFLFSPPLFYWAAETFYASGARIAAALDLGALTFLVLGALGAWSAGRYLWGPSGGLLSTAAFVLSPHLLLDLYVRGNFNEFAAMALLPWAFGAVARIARRDQGGTLLLALAVAGVALTHLGLFVALGGGLACVALAFFLLRQGARPILDLAVGTLLGIGLAAFFLFPAQAHLGDVKADLLRADFLSWEQHFVQPMQLLHSAWGYGVSVAGDGDGMSFAVGPVHMLLAVGAGIALHLHGRRAGMRSLAALLATAVLFALVATPIAAPLWARCAPLQFLAYPWRLLAFVSTALALAAGGCLAGIGPRERRGAVGLAVACAALVAWGAPKARPSELLTFDDEYYAPARIAALGMNTTTREEYEPRAVAVRPAPGQHPGVMLQGRAATSSWSGTPWERKLHGVAYEASRLAIDVLWFPGWQLTLDSHTLTPELEPGGGRIVAALPAGEFTLGLRYGWTPMRRAGALVSLVSLAGTAALALAGCRKQHKPVVGSKPHAGSAGNWSGRRTILATSRVK
jgi:hypothetical protein